MALLSLQGASLSLGCLAAQPCPGTAGSSLQRETIPASTEVPQSDGCWRGEKAQAGCEPGAASARRSSVRIQLPAVWRWWLLGGVRPEGNLLGMLLFGWRSSESFLCSIPALKATSSPWLPVPFLPWPGCRGLGRLSQGTGSWAGGSTRLCCDRGDVGGKQDPSWLSGWN